MRLLLETRADASIDIQYRLLRADAITSLRAEINLVLKDLDSDDFANTKGTIH